MRISLAVAVMALSVGLAGCATIHPDGSAGILGILHSAVVTPAGVLEERSARNDAKAQYALGIAYQYGLNEVLRDAATAEALKRRAMVSRSTMPITQYIAGLNGKPGRSVLIQVPRYDVSVYEARANDSCAKALEEGVNAFDKCGGEAGFRTLKPLWDQARTRR